MQKSYKTRKIELEAKRMNQIKPSNDYSERNKSIGTPKLIGNFWRRRKFWKEWSIKILTMISLRISNIGKTLLMNFVKRKELSYHFGDLFLKRPKVWKSRAFVGIQLIKTFLPQLLVHVRSYILYRQQPRGIFHFTLHTFVSWALCPNTDKIEILFCCTENYLSIYLQKVTIKHI